jgi:hypothetical protein
MGGRPALRLAIVAAAFLVAGPGKNLLYPVVIGRPNRTDFPGKELAVAVAEQWERKYSEPLRLVAGDGWLAGNVACYHPGRPSVYDRKFDPTLDIRLRGMDWTSEEDLTRRGGVFLWDVRLIGDAPPEEFQRCFPQAQIQPPIELNYRCLGHVPPARIGVAVIPPAGHADRSDRIRPTAYSEMPAPTGGRPRNVIRSHGRRES